MNRAQTTGYNELTGNEGSPVLPRGSALSLRILVVDDDNLNQQVMSVLLSQLGHAVETTSSGADAVDLLESQKFDLVFVDVHMPLMDGYELCKRIRISENGRRHIPIVALTASDPSGEAEKCLEAGMDDYLCKPLDLPQLSRVLGSCVNGTYMPAQGGSHAGDITGVDLRVLDIQGALPYVNNDLALYKELLAEFIKSLPGTLAGLQDDLTSASWQKLLYHTHLLKGRSAILGAALLARLAEKMEQQVKEGRTEPAGETLAEIDRCMQNLRSDADELLYHA